MNPLCPHCEMLHGLDWPNCTHEGAPPSHPVISSITSTTTPEAFDATCPEHSFSLVDSLKDGTTVFHQAAAKGNIPLIHHLHQRQWSLLYLTNQAGHGPLSYAIIHHRYEAVEALLQLGAEINRTASDRWKYYFSKNQYVTYGANTTPLGLSLGRSTLPIATLLLRNGAQANSLRPPEEECYLIAQKQVAQERLPIIRAFLEDHRYSLHQMASLINDFVFSRRDCEEIK